MANNYYNFTNPFVPGTKVRSDEMNNELSGVDAGFDKLPSDPDSINTGTAFIGTESGSANTYVVARDNPQTSYSDGDHVGFFSTHDNTSSATLNVDALGTVALVAPDGAALVADDVSSGLYYEAVYDSANNRWQLMSPTGGTISQADLRVTWAEEWANKAEDSLISTAAGGDGIDDYSSLHWSAKSNDSAVASAASAASAAASYDEFDDRYLGSKASDPALDNDGNALLTGAMYWNSSSDQLKIYDGASWVAASVSPVTHYTKDEIDEAITHFASKTVETTYSNDTLAKDAELSLTVSAGTYAFEFFFSFKDQGTLLSGGLKASFDVSTTPSFFFGYGSTFKANTTFEGEKFNQKPDKVGISAGSGALFGRGTFKVASGSTIDVWAAQNTLDVGEVVVFEKGGYFSVTKML